jgi:hypothetical protein
MGAFTVPVAYSALRPTLQSVATKIQAATLVRGDRGSYHMLVDRLEHHETSSARGWGDERVAICFNAGCLHHAPWMNLVEL